jgi:hypothetical protein
MGHVNVAGKRAMKFWKILGVFGKKASTFTPARK